MRCRQPHEDDIERPVSRLEPSVLSLVEDRPEEVLALLEPILSEERRLRIDKVLDGRTRGVVVVLDHLSDPHNGAAVLRSAEALGIQEVHAIGPEGSLSLSRRVTQGCHKWLDLFEHGEAESCIDLLKGRGYLVLGATERARQVPSDYAGAPKVALCLGNEHDGLSPEVASRCDGEVGIQMFGFTRSLNVSVAAGLILSSLVGSRPRGLAARERTILKARYHALSVRAVAEVLERGGLLDGRSR